MKPHLKFERSRATPFGLAAQFGGTLHSIVRPLRIRQVHNLLLAATRLLSESSPRRRMNVAFIHLRWRSVSGAGKNVLHGANLTSCSYFQQAVPDLQPWYCTPLSHNSNVELEPKGVIKRFPLLLAR